MTPTFARTFLATLLSLLPTVIAAGQSTSRTLPPLTVATTGHQLNLNTNNSQYLAIHFLPAEINAATTAWVRSYLTGAKEAAGLQQLFIARGEDSSIRQWAAQLQDDSPSICIDRNDALFQHLRINSTATLFHPFTVVLATDGSELFRHTHDTAPWSWQQFHDRLDSSTRTPSLSHYNLPRNAPLAVEGYDVVAYFTLGKAVPGNKSMASTYRGVRYYFSTTQHRTLFNAAPGNYLPTYGGWCASAMGDKGTKVEIDPKHFKVKDGRLFLFYKSLFADARKDWNANERAWEPAADRNWKSLTNEDPTTPRPATPGGR